MNLQEFQLQGYLITEKENAALIDQIAGYYDKANKEIQAELTRVYAQMLASVDPADYYSAMLRFNRLNILLGETQRIYSHYNNLSNQSIEQSSRLAISNTYYRSQFAGAWLGMATFTALDKRLIELSVTGTTESWQAIPKSLAEKYLPASDMAPQYGSLSELLLKFENEQLVKIQQAITTNLIQGSSIGKMGKSIREIMDNSTYQAERIAWTESSRTANLGHQLASIDAAAQGLNIMRQWVARQDTKTRPNHGRMDGKLAEPDNPFDNGVMRPGAWPTVGDNIHERCQTVDVIVNKDGSIDQAKFRRGVNPVSGEQEIYNWKSFDQWVRDNNLKYNEYGVLYAQ